ncbi:UNVERIFIED_CONTAM: hypothetical protein Sradi_5191600 [Sesamum radiatum]|uniref:Uncharacterized protein n=1 Tax=Sesamum radiatum TaxID=300843 RepID=A0AAW2M5B7_SESRA
MDHQYQELESRRSGSFGRLSHVSSSRRRSFSISFTSSAQNDDAAESESVSEAGDIGDRALHSNRISESGRSHFSLDNVAENGIVVPIPEDTNTFPVTPSALENISPLSVDAIIQSGEKKKDEKRVPWLLEYITCLLSLAVFGILGVKTTNCNTVASGIQFGLLGCLSTVSTFIAEFHAMRESTHPWRAYAYAAITFTISYALGTLIYSVPVWARGYN